MTQDNATLNRMKELMHYQSEGMLKESISSIETQREAADGKTYAIVREGTSYFIKCADTTGKKLVAENFDYVGGFNERNKNKYSSVSNAIKNMDLMLREIRDSRNAKSLVMETTNPDFKGKLVQEDVDKLGAELKRTREIMKNINLVESTGYTVAPVGEGFGKVGDSEPFGKKQGEDGLPNGGNDGFNQEPKDAKENGEPACKGKGDCTKQVPDAAKGEPTGQKPVMKEGVEVPEEELLGGKKEEDGKDNEPACNPDTDPNCDTNGEPKDEPNDEPKDEPIDEPKDEVKDMLSKILDRLDGLEAKVEKLPFEQDNDLFGDKGEGEGEGAGNETVYELEFDDGEGDGNDDTTQNADNVDESTDAAEKFPWLNEL